MKKNKLLNGSIIKSLLLLAVPIMLANLLQTAYQLTDLFWVGRLGPEAVASVSLSFPIIFLFVSLGMGLSIAGSILIAQYKGKNHQRGVDYVAGQAISLTLISAAAMSLIGYILAETIISLMGAEQAVSAGAVSYLHISFIGIVFVFGYMSFQNILRGVGEVRIPLFIVLGTVLLNLVVDPLFILGYGPVPAFGVAGAAVATAVTQAFAFAIALGLLANGKVGIMLKLKNMMPDKKLVKKIFIIGIPSALEMSTRSLGIVFLTFLVAGFGTTVTAAYGIGINFFHFILLPALGLSMATSTLVGQHIGAEKLKRAESIARKSAFSGFVFLTLIGIISFFVSHYFAAAFIPGETAVILESTRFIKTMALAFGFLAVQQSFNGVFRGAGMTRTTMTIAIISLWAIQLPLAYFLGYHTSLGSAGLWISFPVSNIIAAGIAFVIYRTGTWKHKKITHDIFIPEEI